LVELLNQAEDALDAGLDVSTETISQLESGELNIQETVVTWQGKGESWASALQVEIESPVAALSDSNPWKSPEIEEKPSCPLSAILMQ